MITTTTTMTMYRLLTHLDWKRTSNDTIDATALKASINALNKKIPNFPNLDVSRTVDGQRHITFLHPLPASSADHNFALSSKLLGVYDKGTSGTVLETETTLLDTDSGRVYVRYVQSSFYPNQGNWGGTRGPSAKAYSPPKGREDVPDKTLVTKMTGQTALLYRLNGDYNPLHAEPGIGLKMGFGGTILHGLFSLNRAVYGVLREFGGSEAGNLREVQARFAAPVRPGETVLTKMWKMGKLGDGWEEIRFAAYVEGGKAVLTNGRAVVRCIDTTKMGKL